MRRGCQFQSWRGTLKDFSTNSLLEWLAEQDVLPERGLEGRSVSAENRALNQGGLTFWMKADCEQ